MRRRYSSDKEEVSEENENLRSEELHLVKKKEDAPNVQYNRILVVLCGILSIVCIILIISLLYAMNQSEPSQGIVVDTQRFEYEDPETPSVFHDLTKREIREIQNYLYGQRKLELVRPSHNKTNASFIFTMELYLPNKTDVVEYLDHRKRRPPREAIVTIFRNTIHKPEINEVIVGPLPVPNKYRTVPGRPVSFPYFYRPVSAQDYVVAMEYITEVVENALSALLLDAFGTSLKNCDEKCLAFRYISQFSPVSSGVQERKGWYWLHYFAEFYLLHPVNFAVLMKIHSSKFEIDLIWFNDKKYSTLYELEKEHKEGKLKYPKRKFPNVNKRLYSTLHQRGSPPRYSERRDPMQFYPDGARYDIKHRHVEYMDWSFDFRLSTSLGPQVYDIRFRDERIAYEIGLQEIAVFYTGFSPQQKFSNYLDSSELIGPAAKGLVPGVDCPVHATFINIYHVHESSLDPEEFRTAMCIFEWNTGEPLRRHYSNSAFDGAFFEGMPNSILILRTALKIGNYDYIVDFRFCQNGVLEIKAISTGFILANAYSKEETKFAFTLNDHVVGNYHLHLFHFKVDLDINGRQNRYETLDMSTLTEPNPFSLVPNATFTQGWFDRKLKKSELEATFNYDFDYPKYHIFYNKNAFDRYGNPRAYRVLAEGIVKQLLPPDVNQEPSISWARHQMAVSCNKETERYSSSLYSMYDTLDPVVNFTSFIANDESIVDQDLVSWVTMGMHHIPHTEDLPQVTTPGMGKSLYLMPFNYFPEDPAMTSLNAVRIEPVQKNVPKSGVKVERYGKSLKINTCHVTSNDFFSLIQQKPEIMFTE